MQDLSVILKWDNLQSLDKALYFFMALIFCESDFYFLNRRKKCKVATYNIVSVYTRICTQLTFDLILGLWGISRLGIHPYLS